MLGLSLGPVLDVQVSANVGPSTSLDIARTTPGISVGHASAPVASGVPPRPHQSYQSDIALTVVVRSFSTEDLSDVYSPVTSCENLVIRIFLIFSKWC